MTYKQRKWKQEFKSERPKRRGRAGQYAKGKWKQNPLPAPEPLNWSGPYIQATFNTHHIELQPRPRDCNESINQVLVLTLATTRTITLRFFTQVMSFPQKPEIRHQPGQSHWGFCSSHKFSSETRFRTPAIKRQRQAILDLHETSLQHLEVIQCYLYTIPVIPNIHTYLI